MAKEQLMTTATISSIQPGPSASSPYLVRTTDGQTIKGFKEKADELVIGKTYQIPYYDKDYEGTSERMISKFGIIKEVPLGGGPVAPPQHPQGAPSPIPAPPPQTTPMAVANAGTGSRDRSIQALAIIKAVVAVGGTEGEVQRWMDCHDMLVAGKQVG